MAQSSVEINEELKDTDELMEEATKFAVCGSRELNICCV